MTEQYDFVWHGPFRLEHGPDWNPKERLKKTIESIYARKKGLYFIIGQNRFIPFLRSPLYLGATMRTFADRLTEHLSETKVTSEADNVLETGKDKGKILEAEADDWRICSIWLGELRNHENKTVHDLKFAEQTLIYFFDPKYNRILNKAPALECTIINRKNTKLLQKKDPFEWSSTSLPSILDLRQLNNGNPFAEALWFKASSDISVRHKFLSERGALWKRRYAKIPANKNETISKPPIFA